MKKNSLKILKKYFCFICLLSALCILGFNFASAKIITVCSDCEIKTIKEALALSLDGDVIVIKEGYYKENNLLVDKSIKITGENKVVIDLEFVNQGFVIKKENVTVSNLEIRNINVNYIQDLSAIRVEYTRGCTIENNKIYNSFFAVYLAESKDCIIRNNIIKGDAKSESSSGNGIHLWNCSNILIEKNETSGHRDGIYLEFLKNSKLNGNYSHNNLRYGMHFMFSDSNAYTKNVFRENGAGVAVMYTKYTEMRENRFEDNWGPASYGILMKDISNSIIMRNTFYKNTTAVYLEGSDMLQITANNFIENGWAMKILGNSLNNTIISNNFEGNTFDVSSNSTRNENVYQWNYWDKYEGYDMNKDDIGDVSYRPVSLYSMLIEKIPESIILLRSLITDILDVTEKVLPVFIPETLVDNSPRMIKYKYD
ncbi:MAG: putative ABC transporter binding protein NosD [Ignavibacteria bacterium]|nr:putative ABC transporter binding protein NosD [Ignavibacteria bacterium]